MASNMVQIAMHMPPDALDRIDEAARRAGISRAAWIRDAVEGKFLWEQLTEREQAEIMATAGD